MKKSESGLKRMVAFRPISHAPVILNPHWWTGLLLALAPHSAA
jgi:hypothetical protein